MAKTGARNDPFLAFRFEIKLDDLSVGGFSECSGIQLETEVHDYAEGGLNTHWHKFPTRTKQTNITLKRGIVGKELWDWYYKLTQGEVKFRNGSILVHDPSGEQVVMEWQFRQAFPCKWLGPELNATQNNVAVETLELCHHGLERRH
jgi:phage tail-like protein